MLPEFEYTSPVDVKIKFVYLDDCFYIAQYNTSLFEDLVRIYLLSTLI